MILILFSSKINFPKLLHFDGKQNYLSFLLETGGKYMCSTEPALNPTWRLENSWALNGTAVSKA